MLDLYPARQIICRGIAALAVIAMALGALSGCGGGDDAETEQQLTHAQVIKQGDTICAGAGTKASNELTEQIEQLPGALTPETEEELILTVNVPAIESMAAELAELDAPPEDARELEAIATAFNDAVAKVKSNPRSSAQDPYAKASGLAGAFGFIECGKF